MKADTGISIHALLAESDKIVWSRLYFKSLISIHALLAESDIVKGFLFFRHKKFLSTLSLRRATARRALGFVDPDISIHALLAESDHSAHPETRQHDAISIHALLAESDQTQSLKIPALRNFYPRSPCGERQSSIEEVSKYVVISIHALLAESDLGRVEAVQRTSKFLSTLSLRRATYSNR